jgi:hypothetical protein
MTDLVVQARRLFRSLQTVQRRLAGDRRAVGATRLQLARQHGEQRIVPQRVVIVQILIAQRQAEYPLTDQRGDRMLDQPRIAPVDEALRHALDQFYCLVRAPQQQTASVRPIVPPSKPAEAHDAA